MGWGLLGLSQEPGVWEGDVGSCVGVKGRAGDSPWEDEENQRIRMPQLE